jgi:hypothetical protein
VLENWRFRSEIWKSGEVSRKIGDVTWETGNVSWKLGKATRKLVDVSRKLGKFVGKDAGKDLDELGTWRFDKDHWENRVVAGKNIIGVENLPKEPVARSPIQFSAFPRC